jgi:phosphatidylglycerophosphate synthase
MFLAMNVRSFPPSPLGKATTFFEIATVVAILLNNVDRMPAFVAYAGFWVVAACTVGSGAHYIWRVTKGAPKGAPASS